MEDPRAVVGDGRARHNAVMVKKSLLLFLVPKTNRLETLLGVNRRRLNMVFHWPMRQAESCPFLANEIPVMELQWAGNPDTLNALTVLVRKHSPHCIFLIETKSNELKMKHLALRLGFNNYVVVEANGSIGGLTFMWIEDIKISYMWKTDRLKCCSVLDSDLNISSKNLVCYGTPYWGEKENFCSNLDFLVSIWEEPWLLLGDFNEIMNFGEKFGGSKCRSSKKAEPKS